MTDAVRNYICNTIMMTQHFYIPGSESEGCVAIAMCSEEADDEGSTSMYLVLTEDEEGEGPGGARHKSGTSGQVPVRPGLVRAVSTTYCRERWTWLVCA